MPSRHAVRRTCASVAFPRPSSYGCIFWVREAYRRHALPVLYGGCVGVVVTLEVVVSGARGARDAVSWAAGEV
eukprot:COSAG01_NODE_8049_length_2940_cov_28.152763_2_plen_73_part_00